MLANKPRSERLKVMFEVMESPRKQRRKAGEMGAEFLQEVSSYLSGADPLYIVSGKVPHPTLQMV